MYCRRNNKNNNNFVFLKPFIIIAHMIIYKNSGYISKYYVTNKKTVNNSTKSILKGPDDGVLHLKESRLWTLSIVQCFFQKNNIWETGSISVFRYKEGGLSD
jgi:hypothetical protein